MGKVYATYWKPKKKVWYQENDDSHLGEEVHRTVKHQGNTTIETREEGGEKVFLFKKTKGESH